MYILRLPGPRGALRPQPHRSHPLLAAQRRKQVLLRQEVEGEVDQETPDLLHLLIGQRGVRVTQPLLTGPLLQLSHVVD